MSTHSTEPTPETDLDDDQPAHLTAEPAESAAACGTLGCHETDDLVRADHPTKPGRRVVCPTHLKDLWKLSS